MKKFLIASVCANLLFVIAIVELAINRQGIIDEMDRQFGEKVAKVSNDLNQTLREEKEDQKSKEKREREVEDQKSSDVIHQALEEMNKILQDWHKDIKDLEDIY